jgi:hypothetical protein
MEVIQSTQESFDWPQTTGLVALACRRGDSARRSQPRSSVEAARCLYRCLPLPAKKALATMPGSFPPAFRNDGTK